MSPLLLHTMEETTKSTIATSSKAALPEKEEKHSRCQSVATQVSAEDEDMIHNEENVNESPATEADGTTGNANPLFKLVNAAASILDPQKREEKDHKYSKDENSTDEDMTEVKTSKETPASEDTIPASCPTQTAAPASPKPATNESTSTEKINNPVSPTNVIRGTKEDLMLDPKIKISFAEHLYNVLENEEHHDVLNWMPDGKAFTVVNHKKFVLQKMPNLFQIRNMSSFVRKLGRWGFSRVFERETNNSDVFKHPHFIRGDRPGVRKHVKCLGRAAGPANKQTNANGNNAAPRQPDFVVCQEPGKPPVVMPTRVGGPSPPPAMMQHMQQQGYEFRQPPRAMASGGYGTGAGASSSFMPSSLDEVTNASAASAEALYLSHQQQQKAKMEQLASEQQRLEDMEIERLMKRREMRQQQKMQQQQRLFMEQRRLMMEGGGTGGGNINHSSSNNNNIGHHMMQGASGMMGNASSSSQHMESSMQSQHTNAMAMGNPSLSHHHQQPQQQQQQHPGMDLRRVSMQHGGASLDGSLGRSTSSRYSMGSDMAGGSPAQVTPTYDSRKVLSAAYETLQRDELRSRERQAAIRALLAEEQEFEARRRAAYGGGGGAMHMGNHHAAPYMRG